MNEAAAASKALEDVANNQVIMMELVCMRLSVSC